MNKFIYLLIICIFLSEWNLEVLPRVVKLVPEIMFLVAAIIVLAYFVKNRVLAIQAKYVFIMIFTFMLIVIGIIINKVDPGVVINGVRNFLKFVPIFLLPAVYAFTEDEIKNQFKFIFILIIIQIPLAIYQRVFLYTQESGDFIAGTLGNAKILSGILLWCIAILFAFYIKKKIKAKTLAFIVIILLVPIALNETAASLFLLPLAFIAPLFFANLGRERFKYFVITGVTGCIFMIFLVVGYDYTYSKRWGSGGIVTLVTEGRLLEYETETDRNTKGAVAVGRIAAINLAVDNLLEMDPINFLVGVGIGNASDSLIEDFEGRYYEEFRDLGITKHTFSNIIWSFGLFGIILFYIFCIMIFKDAQVLSSVSNINGIIATGFLGVSAIFILQSIYINIFVDNILGALFVYFSGYIASLRIWSNYKIQRHS